MVRKVIVTLVTVLAVLAVALAAVGVWFVRRPWPQVRGAISVSELSAPVNAMMIDLMAQPDNPWFDDKTTPQVETRDDIVRRSLRDAVAWLR